MIPPRRLKTRLDNYGYNMGLKQILSKGEQVGFETDFFILDAQFFPDIVPVEIDRAFRQVHYLRDFLRIFSLLNKI